jgi:hypothetical protein
MEDAVMAKRLSPINRAKAVLQEKRLALESVFKCQIKLLDDLIEELDEQWDDDEPADPESKE